MHNTNILLAFAATAICAVRGQGLGLDNNDVPPECRSICQPVVDVEAVRAAARDSTKNEN